MIETHSRLVEARPFSADAEELQAFSERLLARLAQDGGDASFVATVRVGDRSLTTRNAEELSALLSATGNSSSIDLSFFARKHPEAQTQFVNLDLAGHRATLRASSADEAWSAGIIDILARFAHEHRLWYWWARTWPGTAPLFALVASFPILLSHLAPVSELVAAAMIAGGFVLGGAFGYSYTNIFPSFVLRRSNQNVFRRYSAEIATVAAVVSALAAVVALLK